MPCISTQFPVHGSGTSSSNSLASSRGQKSQNRFPLPRSPTSPTANLLKWSSMVSGLAGGIIASGGLRSVRVCAGCILVLGVSNCSGLVVPDWREPSMDRIIHSRGQRSGRCSLSLYILVDSKANAMAALCRRSPWMFGSSIPSLMEMGTDGNLSMAMSRAVRMCPACFDKLPARMRTSRSFLAKRAAL